MHEDLYGPDGNIVGYINRKGQRCYYSSWKGPMSKPDGTIIKVTGDVFRTVASFKPHRKNLPILKSKTRIVFYDRKKKALSWGLPSDRGEK